MTQAEQLASNPESAADRARVIVLGAGYAGIAAARALAGTDVLLVNKHRYHHLTTLLHQPVVGHHSYRDLAVPLDKILPRSVRVVRGTVTEIEPGERVVRVATRDGTLRLQAEALVLALGWEPQFFAIPGLEEHAHTLANLNQSRLARDHIEESLIAYDENPAETWRRSIIIGGGGLSGVELAGELAAAREELAFAYDLTSADIELTLIEGSPSLLSGLDPWLGARARQILESKGVRCLTGAKVTAVDATGVTLADGSRIPAGTVFWTGGVRANAVLEGSGLELGKAGRAMVDDCLLAKGFPGVFVAGDCALAVDDAGRPLPTTAQLAVQEGEVAGGNALRLVQGQTLRPLRPRAKGLVASVGPRAAIAAVFGRHLEGRLAVWLKEAIAYRYLWQIGGLRLALSKWREWSVHRPS